MNWPAILKNLDDALAASYDPRRHKVATRLRWRIYNRELARYKAFMAAMNRHEERLVCEGFDDVPPFPGYRVHGVGPCPSYSALRRVQDKLHELFPGKWPEHPEYPHDLHVRHVRPARRMSAADWDRQFELSHYMETGIPASSGEERERMRTI